jgi:hypothetical protein
LILDPYAENRLCGGFLDIKRKWNFWKLGKNGPNIS